MKIASLILVFFSISLSSFAQHTFSIVAVDSVTGEIGSAGATCISAEDGALAISDIVLGVGAVHTQAWWVPTNQNNARTRMEVGDSPQQIIDWLVTNDSGNNPNLRQYGVVDLNNGTPRSAAYTGTSTDDVKLHVTGPNYSIQGNILISADVINDMETAFLNTNGTLADKLMAALQGAKRPGADSRCLDFGISSASAFLRVADPSDTDSSYGNLSLDLNVWINGTVFEPIDALQDAYDNFLSINDQGLTKNKIVIAPNPATNEVTIRSTTQMITGFELVDISGKIILQRNIASPQNNIYFEVATYPKGLYFI
ncbi:MAG: DUF1028 domain-containing protein, partial [Flavobacteriaceae bacterium]|nr:DUF1028 domain-containing protein [Flavobacteriaceae bacterium]